MRSNSGCSAGTRVGVGREAGEEYLVKAVYAFSQRHGFESDGQRQYDNLA